MSFQAQIEGRTFERAVLADIKLTIKPGERLCLLGPSGIGKTTLLNLLASLDQGYGKGVWQGQKPQISYLFQQPRLLPWRTLLQNLLLVEPNEPAVMALLKEVGLAEHINQFPTRLSLGMARRAALVRCLLLKPDIVLMDEPLVSLDPVTAVQMRQLIERLIGKNPDRALIYVTHDIEEALKLADRIVLLNGSPASIQFDSPVSDATHEDLISLLS